jgi:hypothetical protein
VKENIMSDTAKMSAGFVLGIGVGIALYFAVVAVLPMAGKINLVFL